MRACVRKKQVSHNLDREQQPLSHAQIERALSGVAQWLISAHSVPLKIRANTIVCTSINFFPLFVFSTLFFFFY